MRALDLQPPHPYEELWEGWARSMRVRGLARGTIRSRRSSWRSWMTFIGDRWNEAGWRDVEAWLDTKTLGESAINRAVSDMAAFYRWARRQDLVVADPTDLVERPKIPRRIPRPADEPGIERALALGREHDRRAVALMYYGGLRCCEVARLCAGDIDLVEGWMTVLGKGSIRRRLPIFPLLEPYLAPLVGEPDDQHAFLTKVDRPASPQTVSHLVNTHLRASGCRFTSHQIRHRFATSMLRRAKGDIKLVQILLGHADISTTQIYTLVELEDYGDIHRLWGG